MMRNLYFHFHPFLISQKPQINSQNPQIPTTLFPMASRSLPSLRHSFRHSLRRSDLSPATLSSSLFLKPPATTAASTVASFSLSAAATSAAAASSSSSSSAVSFDELQRHLAAKNFRQADEETRRLLIALAGDAAQKRGYVYFSEVQFISGDDLRAIDELWRKHSDGKFGYSVQKRIFEKSNKDFTKLFMKLGWMKKLDTEIEQYNYRSFPTEFVWELAEETPEGHLPLTNALRGTQLMSQILSHPAFEEDAMGGEEKLEEGIAGGDNGGLKKKEVKSMSERILKGDYRF